MEGSNGLSVNLGGREGVERRLVVEEDARSETVLQSLERWREEEERRERRPRVEGSKIGSES